MTCARDILVFEVGGMRGGLPAGGVVAVTRAVSVTPLPDTRAGVEGIVDYRGTLVVVVDLRARLGLPPRPVMASDHLIVTWAGERVVAVRVDRALTLARLVPDQLRHDTGDAAWDIARLPDGLAFLHDPRAWLSPEAWAGLPAARQPLEDAP